jgi:hypothetical protein
MKRTAVILVVAAAMGVYASSASGSSGRPVGKGAIDRTLQTRQDSHYGGLIFRLGNAAWWMQ